MSAAAGVPQEAIPTTVCIVPFLFFIELIMLTYFILVLRYRYDRELTHRLRKRLASTISICERLGDYRRSVLRALSEHPLTKASSLAKAFSAAFDGLEVTSSAESEGLYLKYNAITESEIGSSNDSSGSGGSGSTEGIEKESYVAIGGGNPLSPVASTTRGPVLKPSSLPRRRESDEEYDDMFTSPRPARGEAIRNHIKLYEPNSLSYIIRVHYGY